MAFLVPDNLGSRKDVADSIRRVAKAFQIGLDDDVTVWFEPLFDPANELPHLVLLDPQSGVIVIEVLKGKQGSLLGALRGRLRLEIDGTEVEVDNPLERAERFAASLRCRIAAVPALSHVKVGAVAVLSGMSREEAEAKRVGNVIDLDRAVFKPELDAAIQDGSGTQLLRVFQRSISVAGGSSGAEIQGAQIDALRGLIHPDVVIEAMPQQGALFTTAEQGDIFTVMDLKQEVTAKTLGSGHRVIRGVAGSGKTLVLVHRAKLLARVMPSQRILLTCFTRALASQIRIQLSDYPNIEVEHLDSLMARVIRAAGLQHPGYGARARPVGEVALAAARMGGAQPYRAVLVDEAQDFDAVDLEFCVELLSRSRPEEQDLVIVADSAQNIFRKNFRWKDAGIQAQGRTRILRVNYRNTRQVLDFAHAFLVADTNITVDEIPGDDDESAIVPAESSERDGAVPEVRITADAASEVAAVVDLVRQKLTHRSRSRSIAVLYGEPSPGESSRGADVVAALRAEQIPHFWVTDPANRGNKSRAGSTDQAVVVSTIHSAKGLEYERVIVCGVGARDDLTTARKLLYVGFTRATHELSVVTHARSPFAEPLQAVCGSIEAAAL